MREPNTISAANYDQLTIKEATAVQKKLVDSLVLNSLQKSIRVIAGADVSLMPDREDVYAGMVLLSYPDMQPIAYSMAKGRTIFPYVPGYLAFREIPALLQAYEQMSVKPDAIMFDGNGILHARRMGVASHFGVITDTVTLGCAKRKLTGKYDEPGEIKGEYSLVTDKADTLGFALRSKDNVKPIFISPGNHMSLQDSLEIALHCIDKHRLPEPVRKAHELVNQFRMGELDEGFHQIQELRLS